MQNPEIVGMESYIDFTPDDDLTTVSASATSGSSGAHIHRRSSSSSSRVAEKEYPPPIPCLPRTENLHPQMLWVMKKYYTSDGRLIIKEEKVKHHEYFKAHRSNGRLVLDLVVLDDTVEEEEIGDGEGDPTVEEDQELAEGSNCNVPLCGGLVVAAPPPLGTPRHT